MPNRQDSGLAPGLSIGTPISQSLASQTIKTMIANSTRLHNIPAAPPGRPSWTTLPKRRRHSRSWSSRLVLGGESRDILYLVIFACDTLSLMLRVYFHTCSVSKASLYPTKASCVRSLDISASRLVVSFLPDPEPQPVHGQQRPQEFHEAKQC